MSDPATIAFYEREAPNYTASSAQSQSRHLDAFLDRLNPGCRILELGCGGGRDAAHMRERGFAIDPTDGTAAMVKKAQERFALPARTMQFHELEAHEAYDAVWAHASLLHCPRADLTDVLTRIWRALRPGGWHFANFKLGAKDDGGEGRDSLGRLYNFPDSDWLLDQYSAIPGWEIVDTANYVGGGFDKVQRDWIALTVRKETA